MNVGIPGEDRGPAAPQRYGAGHVAKWLLAAVGAALAYLAAQVAALVAIELALPASDTDRLAFVATAASLALAVLWWRHLRPTARLRREGKVLSEKYEESGLLVTALAAGRLLDSLKTYEIQP